MLEDNVKLAYVYVLCLLLIDCCHAKLTVMSLTCCPAGCRWELQVEQAYRGKGLGKTIMQIVELLTWRLDLDKVILTVFKDNVEGRRLYKDSLK